MEPYYTNNQISKMLKFIKSARIRALFSIMAITQIVLAGNYAQENTFSFSFKDKTLKQVFKEIESNTEFRFMYNDAIIDVTQKVSLEFKSKTIRKILDKLLAGTHIDYEVRNKQIILTKQNSIKPQNTEPGKKQVKGIVTDNDGIPLPGVNLVIKGTSIGTITDGEGVYSLDVPSDDAVLVVSYIGFRRQEIPVQGQSTIDIILTPDLQDIDEVVVIGYGTSSKKLLTGSVATVNAAELQQTASLGIESAIQGKTTGVQIVQNSGTPGGAMSVKIRGTSSLNSGTQPLYVIDGVPMITGDFGQIGFEGQGIDASSDLNPSDIESVSILKDASAAAIYGARAANGVILITTKKGKAGKSKINFSGYSGVQKEWKRLHLMNAEEWKEYVGTIDPGFVNNLDPNIDTDWQEEVFRLAPINNYELSLSGGNEITKFYLSGGYFNQVGIVLGSDYTKYSGRINVDHKLNDKLSFGIRVGSNYSINNRIVGDQSINGVLPNAISKPPVYAVRDSLGNYLEEGFWDNPVAIGNEVTNEARTNRNIASLDFNYQVFPDLSIKYQGGSDFYNLYERRYEPTTVRRGANSNGIAIDARSNVMRITNQIMANYTKTFGQHNVIALLGTSAENFNANYSWIRASNFPSDELQYIGEAGTKEESSSSKTAEKINSIFGRLKYNYNNKFITEFSIRRDGSSIFGPNNKFAHLPSFSIAYRLGEEDFIKNLGVFDELKIKLGYGLTGNDQIGQNQYANLYIGGRNYNGQPGLVPKQIPNPDLKWETTHNFNLGADIGLLSNRLLLGMEYYQNTTSDLLMQRPIAGSSGFSTYMDNVGNLTNSGFELAINTTNIDRNLIWTSSLNLSFNKNQITELYNGQPILDQGRGGNAAIENEAIGVFYMYRSLGVDPSTGELVFEDVDGNGVINDADRQIVGDPNPDITGGFTNIFNYRGFDLRIFFQFSYGNDIFNGTRQYAESMKFGTSDNQLVTIIDRWQEPGDITYVPRNNGVNNLFPLSSHYIEDGSYLRLKDLTLGYNFPQQVLSKLNGISNIRLYVKSQNLFTLTNYSGLDPEVNYAGKSNIVQGTDFFTYPISRSLIVGFSFEF